MAPCNASTQFYPVSPPNSAPAAPDAVGQRDARWIRGSSGPSRIAGIMLPKFCCANRKGWIPNPTLFVASAGEDAGFAMARSARCAITLACLTMPSGFRMCTAVFQGQTERTGRGIRAYRGRWAAVRVGCGSEWRERDASLPGGIPAPEIGRRLDWSPGEPPVWERSPPLLERKPYVSPEKRAGKGRLNDDRNPGEARCPPWRQQTNPTRRRNCPAKVQPQAALVGGWRQGGEGCGEPQSCISAPCAFVGNSNPGEDDTVVGVWRERFPLTASKQAAGALAVPHGKPSGRGRRISG